MARWLDAWQAAERGRFALWLPVFMGTGVLAYFGLRTEPLPWLGLALAAPALTACCLLKRRLLARAPAMALAAAAIGFTAAQFATARAPPQPVLPRTATVLTGKVRSVELLPEGRRLALGDVRLDDGENLQRWLRVRLKKGDAQEVATGDIVRIRALVRPPMPPAYPGAWDLQRDAWYTGQAGSGYALGSVELVAHAPPSAPLRVVQRLREVIAERIYSAVPGPPGAICVTLLTGITAGIPPPDREAFSASGLAHLLAVAGLHIGIVMGWTLAVFRLGFATSEYASLRWPTKGLSALAALLVGGGYMVLTGMHVPIVRSFAMACLYTIAVLAGRQAVSLRGLALAATVLMLLSPQEVPGVSFQMSFSAVLALISGYEVLRPALHRLSGRSWPRRLALHLAALALTSALAGTASAPFAAYHFGRMQIYFIVANMVAVPLAAFWVMPAGLIGLLLLPFGLEWLAFVPMGWGASAILYVARTTASWPAATFDVPHMPVWGLVLTALGIAWIGLWRSRLRLAGMPVLALGLISPMLIQPADVLVSADARLIGVRFSDAVYLQSVAGASKFTRDAWLQYWAARAPVAIPKGAEHVDGAIACGIDACLLWPQPKARPILLVRGASHPDGCREASVMVSAEPARGLCQRPWPALVDRFTVWRYGATAIWLDGARAHILTDRRYRGDRPWVPPVHVPRERVPKPGLLPAESE
ncbi:MAG TPA: ComEC/Rec2 family competence protein [Acetobacteraceae bacterium]